MTFALPMLPHDKANHYIYGAITACAAAALAPFVGVHPGVAAQAASFGVGLLKEVYDWKFGTGFNAPDLAVTSVAGTPVALLFL